MGRRARLEELRFRTLAASVIWALVVVSVTGACLLAWEPCARLLYLRFFYV